MAKGKSLKKFRAWAKKYGALAPAIVFFGIIAAVAAAVVVPYVFIWALNELFGLDIHFNFYTWLAAVIIILIFASKRR